jgi:hypothetical protein
MVLLILQTESVSLLFSGVPTGFGGQSFPKEKKKKKK